MPKEKSPIEMASVGAKADPFDTIKEINKGKRPMSSNV